MQKKTFGDKVHQFLRRIGIKETQTLNVADLYARIEELAKSKGKKYISLQIDINNSGDITLKGYIEGNSKSYDGCKTPDELINLLKSHYYTTTKESTIKEIII